MSFNRFNSVRTGNGSAPLPSMVAESSADVPASSLPLPRRGVHSQRLRQLRRRSAFSRPASTSRLETLATGSYSWQSSGERADASITALMSSSSSSSASSPSGRKEHQRACDDSDDNSRSSVGSSVLSDFDLVNDTIQEYLLASDNSEEEDFHGDLDGVTTTLYVSATLPARASSFCIGSAALSWDGAGPTGPSRRRRMAKKAASSTMLSSLGAMPIRRQRTLHASSSTTTQTQPLSRAHRHRHHHLQTAAEDPAGERRDGTRLLPPLRPTHRGVPVGPLTVVLDVDETLVAARCGPIHVRPYVKAFLDLCEELRCEVVVWTAGVASYVNPILHAVADVCGRKVWFHHIISRHRRWYREDCDEERNGVKDLTLLGRSLDRVLLVENNPISVCRQPANAILVEDYMYANEADETFSVLCGIVRRLVAAMSTAGYSACAPRGSVTDLHLGVATPSVAAALDRESALQNATFPVDAVADEAADSTPLGRANSYGPHLQCEEEESVDGSADGGLLSFAQGPQLTCRVLRCSAASLLHERCYGCLNPTPEA